MRSRTNQWYLTLLLNTRISKRKTMEKWLLKIFNIIQSWRIFRNPSPSYLKKYASSVSFQFQIQFKHDDECTNETIWSEDHNFIQNWKLQTFETRVFTKMRHWKKFRMLKSTKQKRTHQKNIHTRRTAFRSKIREFYAAPCIPLRFLPGNVSARVATGRVNAGASLPHFVDTSYRGGNI